MAAVADKRKGEKEKAMITILIYHFILLAQVFIVCRNKTVSIKELLQTFVVGATMSVFGNFIVQGIFSHILGGNTVYYTVGPISEEIFKVVFVAFVLLKTRMGKTTTIQDSALLGAAAGAGFGFTEDTVRALGHGLSFMQVFPGYTFSAIPSLLTSWLPSERSLTSIIDGQFIGGHLLWTALAGIGIGYALRFKNMKWKFSIPIVLLLWVTLDHSLANNPDSIIGFLYPLYGYGMGVRYVFTILLLAAIILDERFINKFLPKDEKLLFPGEKKRSIFGELFMTLINIRFGFSHWRNLTEYFRLRRQLAVVSSKEEKPKELYSLLLKQKINAIAAARFDNKNVQVSGLIARFWAGPSFRLGELTLYQKVWLAVIIISSLSSLFVGWLLLFSLYFPYKLTFTIVTSPPFAFLGILGYLVTIISLIEFYRKRQWQSQATYLDRVSPYTNAILIHSSALTALIYLPGFLGIRHPLLGSAFFWDQFRKYWEALKEAQKWIGGTVSAAIGFLPGIGNAKSFAEFGLGYDYLADKPVTGWDRLFAGIGAIPVVGNLVRGTRYAVQIARVVKAADTIDKVAGKVNFAKAARDDLAHAYSELAKDLTALSVEQTRAYAKSRADALDNWQKSGYVSTSGSGRYSMPVSNKKLELFVGKDGAQGLGLKVGTDKIGQVSVDHSNKSIMFDTITEHGQSSGEFGFVTKSLQEKYPDYTVMERQAYDSGFSSYNVVAPDGTKSQFYSVPTVSSHQVSMVGSR